MSKNDENTAILKDKQGRDVALKGVNIRARLHGLMAEVEVEQIYQNPRKTNIEAVYTFPLPISAVLLGLDVEIAGRKISGHVVEKKQAERDYEDAVTDGNSAVMLEEAGPGLYTASIGNLMAKESAVIRYRYGLLLSWQRSCVRFQLPTTIAPRYGNAEAAGLKPHQIPTSALDVEYPLDLSIAVEGELANATIASPSHLLSVGRTDHGVIVRLAGKAVLDRDFILTLESEKAQSSCVLVPDQDGQVALASLRIPPAPGADDQTLALKVVIDCSGSMGGTSITQARKAALEILNQLRPQDYFNVTLFGDRFKHLFPKLVPASSKHISDAWARLDKLDADMGGTEMEKALDAVFSLGGAEGKSAVLLITDGEIHEHVKLVKRAQNSGHRVFVVGVGTAVAEAFLKSLVTATGGACELVAPQEGMAERVLSQFHRMRQPKLGQLQIEWPAAPAWQTALPETVFAGDTVHVFAGFGSSIAGTVKLVVNGGDDVDTPIAVATEVNLPRIAAAWRIETATEKQGLELSLSYQLLSLWTNYLVIAERDVKAGELPEIHQVPQMLAAGWGGSGFVCSDALMAPAVFRHSKRSVPANLNVSYSFDDDRTPKISTTTPAQFIVRLESVMSQFPREPYLAETIDDLVGLGLEKDLTEMLRKLIRDGYEETQIIAAFIYALSESPIGHLFGRNAKRAIFKGWKNTARDTRLGQLMWRELKELECDCWGYTEDIPF